MMKKILLFSALLASFSFVSCKRKGCTNEKATNYSESAKKDDGSCNFEANIVVWVTPFNGEAYIDNGITELKFYLDQELLGVFDPAVHTSTGIPTCDGTEGQVFNVKLSPDGFVENHLLEWIDQEGVKVGEAHLYLQGNDCKRQQLFW